MGKKRDIHIDWKENQNTERFLKTAAGALIAFLQVRPIWQKFGIWVKERYLSAFHDYPLRTDIISLKHLLNHMKKKAWFA